MNYIIALNFFTLAMVIGVTLQIVTGELFDRTVEKLFLIGLLIVFVLVFTDTLNYYFSTKIEFKEYRYIVASIGYIIRPTAIAIFVTVLLREAKNYIYIWIPILILITIVVTNYFTHIMFYYDDLNNFHRGPLGLIAHIVSAFYMFLLVFFAIKMYNNLDKFEVMTVLFIMIVNTLAVIMESVFNYMLVLPGAMAITIAVYYIYLNTQIYKIDVLTGLLNRRSFYNDAKKMSKRYISIISIDLNNLKVINDIQGHAMGDKAICDISRIMVKISKKKFRAYRIGGDEFMLLGTDINYDESKKIIRDINQELDKTEYTASFGCAIYKPGDDFDEICVLADMEMYKNKAEMKQKLSK